MPHTRVHSGDQMPPPRGHFTGTKMTEGRRKHLQLSNKIFINITKTEKHCWRIYYEQNSRAKRRKSLLQGHWMLRFSSCVMQHTKRSIKKKKIPPTEMQHVKVIDLPVIGIVFHCKHNQEPICSWQDFFPPEIRVGAPGGGVLPYITYTVLCRPKGSWFWSSWFRMGCPFQRRFLERGIIFRMH